MIERPLTYNNHSYDSNYIRKDDTIAINQADNSTNQGHSLQTENERLAFRNGEQVDGEVVKTCVLTQLTLSLSHPLLLLLPASVHTPVADRVLLLVLRDLIKDKQGHGDPFDAIFQHVPLAPALVHGFQQPELDVAAALTPPLALAASSPRPPWW